MLLFRLFIIKVHSKAWVIIYKGCEEIIIYLSNLYERDTN